MSEALDSFSLADSVWPTEALALILYFSTPGTGHHTSIAGSQMHQFAGRAWTRDTEWRCCEWELNGDGKTEDAQEPGRRRAFPARSSNFHASGAKQMRAPYVALRDRGTVCPDHPASGADVGARNARPPLRSSDRSSRIPAADARPRGTARPGARLVRPGADVRPYLAARERLQRGGTAGCRALLYLRDVQKRAAARAVVPGQAAEAASGTRASGAHAAGWGSGVWRVYTAEHLRETWTPRRSRAVAFTRLPSCTRTGGRAPLIE
ncbi:hypothetical protein HYPSUDRAFT_78986 [Hypholoma sublateritium FD-334 SS-4]|uniref:Uncharacterized protein n=1 Tax=Hypholoma sublateritium (strain FD-334 SS-4) TaxID=945553 RepID=A0A0D2PFM2_HYPSF|nr:hypothetical protein HYPSUDRAFT_78986 [Hypholoma sublateritium FD-334 SS-4]